MLSKSFLTLCLALLAALPLCAQQGGVTVRVQDITRYRVPGEFKARNSMVGVGLVVGLNGTGDKKDKVAAEMFRGLREAFLPTGKFNDEDFASGNIAAVTVTAYIDEGITVAGAQFTATVAASAPGTSSLEGGTLMPTLLKLSARGDYVAEAGGQLAVSKPGGGAGGAAKGGGNSAAVTAQLIDDLNIPFFEGDKMVLSLLYPNANTANAIARAVNEDREILGIAGTIDAGQTLEVARADGPGQVVVAVPERWRGSEMVFRGIIDNVSVNPDVVAAVAINQKTGVIAITGNVRVLPAAIVVGGVSITIDAAGNLPKKLAPGEVTTDPAIPVNEVGAPFQQLLDTFTLLRLSVQEQANVWRALRDNGLLQGQLVEVGN